MEKPLSAYTPIDMTAWDRSGQGVNIKPRLKPEELAIWDAALPYQDKRLDVGHAEYVTYFALQLLDYVTAERAIVIPAAILHDVGWSALSQADLNLFNDPEELKKQDARIRRLHQEAGVKLAKGILTRLVYPEERITHIIEIVSQHDTRKGSYSPEDMVMRDADKLWRFTVVGVETELQRSEEVFRSLYEHLQANIDKDGFFGLEESRHLARAELEQTARLVER